MIFKIIVTWWAKYLSKRSLIKHTRDWINLLIIIYMTKRISRFGFLIKESIFNQKRKVHICQWIQVSHESWGSFLLREKLYFDSSQHVVGHGPDSRWQQQSGFTNTLNNFSNILFQIGIIFRFNCYPQPKSSVTWQQIDGVYLRLNVAFSMQIH